MWTCLVCDTEIEEDSWETCWRCSADRGATPDEVTRAKKAREEKIKRFMSCLRCGTGLTYDGTKRFKEEAPYEFEPVGRRLGSRPGRFDIYHCPDCGHLEFFLDGVGDEKRGEND